MPVNIYDLTQDRKTVTLEIGGGQLTVTYRPNQLTPARELAMLRQARAEADESAGDDEELAQAEYNVARQLETFAEIVEAWDFMGPLARHDDTGERLDLPRDMHEPGDLADFAERHGGSLLVPPDVPVPIRPDCLVLIGSNFLMRVVALINEDMRPNPKGKRTGGGS